MGDGGTRRQFGAGSVGLGCLRGLGLASSGGRWSLSRSGKVQQN